MRLFNLPDLGEGLQEAEIVEWHVRPGEEVRLDQPMVSVETDKAIVEIPAPYAGRIDKVFGEPGERVHVGAPLVGFAGETEDTGTVVGELALATRQAESVQAAPATAAPVRVAQATPAVRALARTLGVDLTNLKGSGPHGTITREDVKRAATPPKHEPHNAGEPLRGMRRTMAQNMARSHAEVAAVTIFDDADVEAWAPGTPILARLVRAMIAACRAEPALNAWFDAPLESRRLFAEVHLGIAVDSAEGLLVPVLRDAQDIPAARLAEDLNNLVSAARARTVSSETLRGASIVLSNYGGLAGRYATPMVVPPMVAILGAGRLAPQPVAVNGNALAVHRVLPLSLTFDHRAVTGGEAARFLQAIVADLQRA